MKHFSLKKSTTDPTFHDDKHYTMPTSASILDDLPTCSRVCLSETILNVNKGKLEYIA